MQSGVKTLSAGGGASLCCLLLLWLIYSHLLREGKDTYLFITLSVAPGASYWDAHGVVREKKIPIVSNKTSPKGHLMCLCSSQSIHGDLVVPYGLFVQSNLVS